MDSCIRAPAVSIIKSGFVCKSEPSLGRLHPCKSVTIRSLTESWATNLFWYISILDHCMIDSFILYCSTSMVETTGPLNSMTLSKMDLLSPYSPASTLLTVGSSCLWSPAMTSFLQCYIAIQHWGSMLWAHSSITKTSNRWEGRTCFTKPISVLSAALVRVQQITEADLNIWSMCYRSMDFTSLRSILNSEYISFFSPFEVAFFSFNCSFLRSYLAPFVYEL